MKISKLTTIIAVLLSFALILTFASCGGAGGTAGSDGPVGTITLNFNRGSASRNARAAAPTDDILAQLIYTVQLKGPATVTATTKAGEQRLSLSAPAGQYTLTLTAMLNGAKYAEGSSSVKIEAGKTTSVAVQMTVLDGGNGGGIIIQYFDFEGSDIAEFATWLSTKPYNDTVPYDVKLNLTSLGKATASGSLTNMFTSSAYGGVNYGKKINLDISGSKLTGIEDEAFSSNNGWLISIKLPNSIKSIGSGAFLMCTGLTSITLPAGVTSIGESAFAECTGLTSITIPGSVTSIGDTAFYECNNLTTVTFGQGSNITSTNFGSNAFPGLTGGGETLTNLYKTNGGAGTYKRSGPNMPDWAKLP